MAPSHNSNVCPVNFFLIAFIHFIRDYSFNSNHDTLSAGNENLYIKIQKVHSLNINHDIALGFQD